MLRLGKIIRASVHQNADICVITPNGKSADRLKENDPLNSGCPKRWQRSIPLELFVFKSTVLDRPLSSAARPGKNVRSVSAILG